MAIDYKNVTALIKAPFQSLFGGPKKNRYSLGGQDNNFLNSAWNAAGTNMLATTGTDALNNLLVGDAVNTPLATPLRFQIANNAKIATVNPFFCNCNDVTPLQIVAITCTFGTTAGSASTGYVSKEIQGQAAPGSTCMSGTFNLNATANTPQTATLAGNWGYPSLTLYPGEQLTFNISAVAALANLYVTVWVRPATGTRVAQYVRVANGDIATFTMDLNIIPGSTIRAVAMRWGTAGTNSGTVTMDITKDTSTNAPGAGTSILAAAQSVKGTANTTVYPALSTTAGILTMAAGDRLAAKTAGTLTALAQLVITVFYTSGPDNHLVVPIALWDGVATDRTVFLANGGYIVSDCWETWSTASTSNTQLLTKDTSTTAPGAGTGLQTDNTNAGILTSATANTPVGSLLLSAVSTKPTLWLASGDRLGLKNGSTTGALAGSFIAVLLRKP